ARPTSASAAFTRCAARTALTKSSALGGSRSSTRWVACLSDGECPRVGWYSTARWLPNHSRERRSLHSAYDTVRLDASVHTGAVSNQSGAYLGTFFCM